MKGQRDEALGVREKEDPAADIVHLTPVFPQAAHTQPGQQLRKARILYQM